MNLVAEAAQELLKRRQARSSLLHFIKYTYPQYIVEPVHELIASKLDACVQGDIKKLMIFTGPQHGKSELASVRFPAYWLGNRPNDPVIISSYGASLAESKSRQVRGIVEGIEYARLFPNITTDKHSRSVEHWSLCAPYRGGLKAAGVGGPVTGHGALLGLIDDPLENWEQAQSQTIRDKVWDWYRSTFRTRIWENGVIVLIMTRWHPDDIAGRLLNDQGNEWDVLRLPVLAETQEERDFNNIKLGLPVGEPDPLNREPGDPLSPRRFSKDALLAIKRDVGSLAWAAEYQGVPTIAEGNRVKREWLSQLIDTIPARCRMIRYWDKAAVKDGGCATAGVLMAAINGIYYIVDVVTGHWSPGERESIIKQTAALDYTAYNGVVTTWIEQEPGSGGKESADSTIMNLAGYAIYADKVTGSKDIRLEPFIAQCESGNVRLVKGKWNSSFIDELTAIPNSQYRDQADACAGAFNKLTLGESSIPLPGMVMIGTPIR